MDGLRSQERPVPKELREATIDGSTGKLIANGEVYELRNIQNVELRRTPDGVDVYIGYLNPNKRTMFSRAAVDRIFAGSTQTSSDIANVFRHQFRVIGVPVIEL